MSATKRIDVRLLGPFQAVVDGRKVAFRSASSRALLGILLLSDAGTESRARLGAMLWYDADDQQVRKRLRQALYALRSALGPARDAVIGERDTIVLDPCAVTSDLADAEAALAQGVVPPALIDHPDRAGMLLADLPDTGPLYSSWLTLRHRAIETRLTDALRAIQSGEDPLQAERASQALLSLDPSDEMAARELIARYARAGETGRALKVYNELWAYLDEYLDMEPGDATQALIAEVKLGRIESPALAQAPDVARAIRLGIGPPADGFGQAEQARIADLFKGELIARLSRFREVEIVDTCLRPDTTTDYLLCLGPSGMCAETRLTLTLARTATGQILWSRSYAELSANWSDKIFSVADSVSAVCNLGLSRARLIEIRRSGPGPRAFDHWLIGQMLLDDFRAESWEGAIQSFNRAIEIDPYFSGAWSSLSQVRNIRHLAHPGIVPDQEELCRSRDLANRAIALDPEDSRAHLCRAWASLLVGEFDFAEGAFVDALELNPNDPWTVISSALGAAFGGKIQRALALAERMMAEKWSNLPSIWGYHATIRFLSGDYELSVEAAENAHLAILNIPAWKAAALIELGRDDEAAAAWQVFEEAARPAWAGEGEATTEGLLTWFRASFPIRYDADRQRLHSSVTAAVRHYLHCVQR